MVLRPQHTCVGVELHDDVDRLVAVGLPGGGDDGAGAHRRVLPVELVTVVLCVHVHVVDDSYTHTISSQVK